MHLTPKIIFSLNQIYLLFEPFGQKQFWICLNPRFPMPFQSCAWSVAQPSCREPGAAVADDASQEPNTMASQSALYICSRKWNAKLILPVCFGTKMSNFCFKIISLSSLELEVRCDSKDSEINFNRARSTTANLLLGALRSICNNSSGDGEDLCWRADCVLRMENLIQSGGEGKLKAGRKLKDYLYGKFVT